MTRFHLEAFDRFPAISLDGLNSKAAMLERRDNKYVVPWPQLQEALATLEPHFDVLEIDGCRSFVYRTRYLDDGSLSAYYDHLRGKRKRCKIRIREYVDSELRFLEVKLKDARDATVKKRLALPQEMVSFDRSRIDFVENCYASFYGTPFMQPLRPVLGMSYVRTTLVARQGGERMTIDSSLAFGAKNQVCYVDPGLTILETKSANGRGLADEVLRRLHLHPVKACSKYCLGMAATRQVSRFNRFIPAMRRLGLL